MSNSSEKSTSNEDIQQTLRKLNSSITFSAVGPSGPASRAESPSSGEEQRSSDGSDTEEEPPSEQPVSSVVKDWSKKCISISVAKKSTTCQDGDTSNVSELTQDSTQKPSSEQVKTFKCSFCKTPFESQNELVSHILICKRFGGSVSFANTKETSDSEEFDSQEEEEEEGEEESGEPSAANSIAALKARAGITATVAKKTPEGSKDSLATLVNLPKGISISSSSSIVKNLPKGIAVSKSLSTIEDLPKGISISKPSTVANLPKGISISSPSIVPNISKGISISSPIVANLPKGIAVSSSPATVANLPKSISVSSPLSALGNLPKGITISKGVTALGNLHKEIAVSSLSPSVKNLPKSISVSSPSSTVDNLPKGISLSTSHIDPQTPVKPIEEKEDSDPGPETAPDSIVSSKVDINTDKEFRDSFYSDLYSPSPSNSEEEFDPDDTLYIPGTKKTTRGGKGKQQGAKHKASTESLSDIPQSAKEPGRKSVSKRVIQPRRDLFEFIGFSDNPTIRPAPKQKKPIERRRSVGRKSTAKPPPVLRSPDRPCVPCNINNLGSANEFNYHHRGHVKNSKLVLKRLPSGEYSVPDEDSSSEATAVDPDSSCALVEESSDQGTTVAQVHNPLHGRDFPPEEGPLPEDFASAKPDSPVASDTSVSSDSTKDAGSLKLTFKISQVEEPGRNKKRRTISILNPEDMQEVPNTAQPQGELPVDSSNILFPESSDAPGMPEGPNQRPLSNDNQFAAESVDAFGNAAPAEVPHSSYEPQFESYTGDWLAEYESGERIAAAMTGAVPPPEAGPGMYDPNQPSSQPQGSFEQLCINDSYSQNSQPSNAGPSMNGAQQQSPLPQHAPYGGGGGGTSQGGDIFSDLNSYGGRVDRAATAGSQPTNDQFMNGSNSSTTSSLSSHPSPGDSFRSLALSPQGTPSPMSETVSPTPPFPSGSHGGSPLDNSVMPNPPSGGQPVSLPVPQESTMELTTPRLTIANNLMPPAPSGPLTPLMGMYNQPSQWSQNSSAGYAAQSYPSNAMGPPGTIRPAMPGLPPGYRPSPRPRVRGRPPLMDGMTRGMMRGPGRPPGPNAMNGGRGGISQRGSMSPYGPGSRMSGPQKRPLSGSPNHSPAKMSRREEINVPSRQKDNDCQIIAVANRNEGMPVISSVQGNSRTSSSSPANDSTIHLSDSITLSVRPNVARDIPRPGAKGGDAGVVANLLASRGITVTPAAGEKEGGGVGVRGEERRLPSASDLNLSSAISVHPPSRDREGFAVPQPPQGRSSVVNDTTERPVRPPTVDLTQEMSSGHTTRLQCSQCDRTFATSTLLADHAKVHQQQQQSRMPYKCHLCQAGFSAQKGQQAHYQQFHQLNLSVGDLAIPIVDVRNPVTQRKMHQLGVRAFLPLTNLQNRGAGGVVGIPILTLENINNGQMSLQQWGITDVMSLGPPKTFNTRSPTSPIQPRMPRPPNQP